MPTGQRPTANNSGNAVLRHERLARGWTQQQTVDQLKRLAYERGYGNRLDGLDVNALSRYEHGRIRRPHAPVPELFAALYQCPVWTLFPAAAPAAAVEAAGELAAPPTVAPAGVVLSEEAVRQALTAILAGVELLLAASGPHADAMASALRHELGERGV